MGAVKDMLMDVEQFVYNHYDKDGQLTEATPVIVAKAKQRFGVTFGEYAEVGFFQYLAPSLQFGLAIWVFQEPFDPAQWWTFGLIWLGLALFTANMVLRRRA